MKTQNFLSGVFVLIFGAFFAKVLGAVYRIPLTWVLGAEGLGVYQLVFPIFSLILVISSSAMPLAISKVVAKHRENSFITQKILKDSLIVCGLFGVFFGFSLFFLADLISNFQGNLMSALPTKAIAPAVFFVALISCFRGYFQGKLNMVPTTISNVLEQLLKLVFGLLLSCWLLKFGLQFGVLGAVLGVVLSEIGALLFLFLYYLKTKSKMPLKIKNENAGYKKTILKTALPILVANLVLPFSIFVDSLFVVRFLVMSGQSLQNATILWGIDSGIVSSILNFPAVITLSIATALVPNLSKTNEKSSKTIKQGFIISTCLSVFFFVFVFGLSKDVITFLYGQNFAGLEIALKLMIASAFLLILITFLQTQNAVLQGTNKAFLPVVSMLFAFIVKFLVLMFLVPNKNFGIFGLVFAKYAFFAVAIIVNAVFFKLNRLKVFYFSRSLARFLIICLVAFGLLLGLNSFSFGLPLWFVIILKTTLVAGVFLLLMPIFFGKQTKMALKKLQKLFLKHSKKA